MPNGARHWSHRLPFYYGWLIVGIAFVTMAIGVSARTAFSSFFDFTFWPMANVVAASRAAATNFILIP